MTLRIRCSENEFYREFDEHFSYHFKLRKLGLTTFQLIKLGNARKNDDSFDFSKQEKFKLRKIDKLYKKLGRLWFVSLQEFVSSDEELCFEAAEK